MANITSVQGSRVPSASATCVMAPEVMIKSVTLVLKCTSPPCSSMVSRIFCMIPGSLLVPICGRALTVMSSGAPWATRSCNTFCMSPRLSERVYSLPSE